MRVFEEDRTSFLTPLVIEDRGLVLFVAAEAEGGSELWRTDGTAAGTSRWVDALPGPLSADPSNLARLGDRLFFFAADEAHGREPRGLSLDYTPGAPDVTAPALTCPASVTVRASGPDGADVSYPPATVTDERGETVTPTYSRASGSRFPVGETTVTVTAEDAAGNEAQCSFLEPPLVGARVSALTRTRAKPWYTLSHARRTSAWARPRRVSPWRMDGPGG